MLSNIKYTPDYIEQILKICKNEKQPKFFQRDNVEDIDMDNFVNISELPSRRFLIDDAKSAFNIINFDPKVQLCLILCNRLIPYLENEDNKYILKSIRMIYKAGGDLMIGNPGDKIIKFLKKLSPDITSYYYKDERIIPITSQIENRLNQTKNKRKTFIQTPGKHTTMQEGFVYVIGNTSYPGYLKIGATIDYESRLNDFQICSPIDNFFLLKTWFVPDRFSIEKTIHSLLDEYRVKGEWFKIENIVCVDTIERFLKNQRWYRRLINSKEHNI